MPVVDDAGNPIPFDADEPVRRRRERDAHAAAGLRRRRAAGGRRGRSRAARTTCSSAPPPTRGGRASRRRARWRACPAPTAGTMSSGIVDADSRVAVDSVSRDLGLYATDTFSLRRDLFVTAALRFNVSALTLEDRLGGALGGDHTFHRLNPALGVSYQPLPVVGGYAGYSESTRVPTPLELTCASETDPCRLPNGFISDPPLAAVVARTFELGVRGRWKRERGDAGLRRRRVPDHERGRHPVHQLGRRRQPRLLRQRRRHAPPGDRGEPARAAALRRRWRRGAARMGDPLHLSRRALPDRRSRSCRRRIPTRSAGRSTVPAGARIPSVPAHIGKAAVTWFGGAGVLGRASTRSPTAGSSTGATRRTCWRRCPASS